MAVYLNIGRNGLIKITQQPMETDGSSDFLSSEMREGCTIEEVYAAVLPNVSWKERQFYVPEIDVEDDDEACDEAINFSGLIEAVLGERV